MDSKRLEKLQKLESIINYSFKDKSILNNALTHSSFINNKNNISESNERMEFIGDSILSYVISVFLYEKCENISEGQLTKIRANIVCEQSLFLAASEIKLGEFLLISKGEENTGGRNRPSIMADAYEALIAALYIDGGIENSKKFVQDSMSKIIQDAINNKIFSDYKTFLQEHCQKHNFGELIYSLSDESGPDHNKTFKMIVSLDETIIGMGVGHSKKDAQQAAAKNAIEKLGVEYE